MYRWLCALFVLAACSQPAPDAADLGTVDPRIAACAAVAKAQCARLAACSPYQLAVAYPSEARCAARVAALCEQRAALPGSRRSAATLTACAADLAALPCADVLGGPNLLPSSCLPPGELPSGAGCQDDGQCQSVRCKSSNGCGACAARYSLGFSCQDDAECTLGLRCSALCVRPGARDAACGPGAPCQAGLSCQAGTCVEAAALRAPCTGPGTCDGSLGLFCGQDFKCAATAIASLGEPCGMVAGSPAVCGAAGGCFGSAGAQRCAAAAADGAACAIQTGPLCQTGATCLGTCAVLPPACP